MNHDSRWHVWDSSALFLRPNDTPQLLARLASRLLALAPIPTPVPVASGLDGEAVTVAMGAGSPTVEWRALGRWYDVVRRRCTCVCESRLATPIVGEPSGEGMFELLRAPGMPPVPMPIATVSLEPEPDPESQPPVKPGRRAEMKVHTIALNAQA